MRDTRFRWSHLFLALSLLLIGCTRQAGPLGTIEGVTEKPAPGGEGTPAGADPQCVASTGCEPNGGGAGNPAGGGSGGHPTGGGSGQGSGPDQGFATAQAIAQAALAKQFTADTLVAFNTAKNKLDVAQTWNNRVQVLNTSAWEEKSHAQNNYQIATVATQHAVLSRQASDATAPVYNNVVAAADQTYLAMVQAETSFKSAKLAAENATAYAQVAQTITAMQAMLEAQTASAQAKGFYDSATLAKDSAIATAKAAIDAVNSSRGAAQVAEDAAAVSRQPKVSIRYNVPASSLAWKMWGAWNGDIGNWFNTGYDARASLFHASGMTRIGRDEGLAEGCFAIDYDNRHLLGNYLCVNKGKGAYNFRKFSEVNQLIGNVADQNISDISGLHFSTMASVWGRQYGTRVSVITESDPSTGMVGLFSIDAQYGTDVRVPIEHLEVYGFNFHPPWQKDYTVSLDSAASRYCRDHYPTVDGYNRTLGGKFFGYDGRDVAFTCL